MIFLNPLFRGIILSVLVGVTAAGESPLARFVGTPACASSSCHGGAGPQRNQLGRWESLDVHRRSASTLQVARSEQIARGLGLTNSLGQATAAQSARCTVCHAPNALVPAAARRVELDATEGVACEACHAPAEPWLRSHTRPGPPRDDFTRADKVAAGMRDLRDLRVRANVCVACHENVPRELLAAGHPELLFELDGQTRQEPRHWVERSGGGGGYQGAQAWLVGQAVAWREVAWQAQDPAEISERQSAREAGLAWLVTRSARAVGVTATTPDAVARAVATRVWSTADTVAVLRVLAGSAVDFRAAGTPVAVQARRAERLVLALDRLLAASPTATAQAADESLNSLLQLAQGLPDFAPARFAAALDALAARLPGSPAAP